MEYGKRVGFFRVATICYPAPNNAALQFDGNMGKDALSPSGWITAKILSQAIWT